LATVAAKHATEKLFLKPLAYDLLEIVAGGA